MRLNFGRRLVLFINWLLSLAGCALLVTLFVWPRCMETMLALLERRGFVLKLYVVAVLIVYLIFAVGAVCILFGGRKSRDRDAFIIVDSSDAGHSRIAVSAVNQMIRQAVRGVDGIAEMKANIINNEDSIDIAADVAIRNGVHVPTVTANIQRAIRGYIERNCGVAVRGVSVSVHSLTDIEDEGRRGRRKKTRVANEAKQTSAGSEQASAATPEWTAKEDAAAPVEPLPEPARFDEPEAAAPDYRELPVESEPEPVSFDLPSVDEPITLTLDSEPEVPAVEEATGEAVEESAPAAEEAPAVEVPAVEEPAQKKRLFGRLFGKREKAAPADGEPAAPEAVEPAEPVADEAEAFEPAADAPAAEEYPADEPAAEEAPAEESASEEYPAEEPEPWSGWYEDKDGQN